MNKRTFIKNTSLIGLSSLISLNALSKTMLSIGEIEAAPEPGSDDYWAAIRKQYDLTPDYINLENGYYCIMPNPIRDKYLENIKKTNLEGAHYMRTVQFDNKKKAATKLADMMGVTDEELVITRNTTESLDLIISGFQWQPGDEAIMAEQDYGAMLDMFRQMSKRYGTVNKMVSVPPHPKSDDEIVDLYAGAISRKTKLLMVCHMINITGQVLPVRKICDMAHSHGVAVMVDGAHAVAHLDFKIPDLNCDYYGASLHKWLSTPLGAGMLYVKKNNIAGLWPIFAEGNKPDNDISRLNHTGTNPVAVDLTIPDAIDFYQNIGAPRKQERLRYLQQYWTSKVGKLNNVVINTPEDPQRSCAIANVGISNMKPGDLQERLLKQFGIYTVAIDNEKAGVQGCRVTPNIYTTTDELDALVNAIKIIAR